MVETAIVMSLILLVMFGIIDFGRALYTYHLVENAAREGSRWAMVRGTYCTPRGSPPDECPATAADIQTYVQSVSPLLDTNSMTVTPTWGTTPASNGATCNGVSHGVGCEVTVSVTYQFNFLLPMMPGGFQMAAASQASISQ
jgi:Flp pilus assembly protein TadG